MFSCTLLFVLAFCVFPVLDAYSCEEIFTKATALNLTHSDAEINEACRLNLQHIEPHVLAPYLDILRTTPLLACFYTEYDIHAPGHSEEYLNKNSHIIAVCKPGAVCFTQIHANAFERGCVDGLSSKYQNTCADDFCNHMTNTDMNVINNILSTLTTTATPTLTNSSKPTLTNSATPKADPTTTVTPAPVLNPSTLTCDELFKKVPMIDFTQSNAEVNEACRLNLQHIEPHVLAPYLDILRTTPLLACFYTEYDIHAPGHSEEYLNKNSHTIAVCKPGARCFNQRHSDAYERGCVDGSSPQYHNTCDIDFCNNRTQLEMVPVNNILSIITTTTTTTPSTTTMHTTTTTSSTTKTTPKPTTSQPTTPIPTISQSTTTSQSKTTSQATTQATTTSQSSTTSQPTKITSQPITTPPTTTKPPVTSSTTTTTLKPAATPQTSTTTQTPETSTTTVVSNCPACRNESFCLQYAVNTGACNKPIDETTRDFFDQCALACNKCQEYCQFVSVTPKPTPAPRHCHQCGDLTSSSPCSTLQVYTAPSTLCPAGLDFCMTDIHHDASGNDNIYKRCVSRQVCESQWLSQTSDQDHCINFGQVFYSGEFSCHFCCTQDGCNTRLVPDHNTFFTKT